MHFELFRSVQHQRGIGESNLVFGILDRSSSCIICTLVQYSLICRDLRIVYVGQRLPDKRV